MGLSHEPGEVGQLSLYLSWVRKSRDWPHRGPRTHLLDERQPTRWGLGEAPILGGGMVQAWGWPGAAVTGQAAWGGQAEGGAALGPPEAFSHSLIHSFTHSLTHPLTR